MSPSCSSNWIRLAGPSLPLAADALAGPLCPQQPRGRSPAPPPPPLGTAAGNRGAAPRQRGQRVGNRVGDRARVVVLLGDRVGRRGAGAVSRLLGHGGLVGHVVLLMIRVGVDVTRTDGWRRDRSRRRSGHEGSRRRLPL